MDIRMTRTRTMLRDALQGLLDEKPFEEISVSELCDRSTVRRATFYRHFKDKYEFYEWYLTTITDQFMAELGEGADLEGLEEYTRYMHRKLIEFAERNRSWFGRNMGKTALAGSLDMVMRQAAVGISERLESWAVQEGAQLGTTSEFISMFYAGGMVHTLRWWLENDRPMPPAELERHCTAFLMGYLRT